MQLAFIVTVMSVLHKTWIESGALNSAVTVEMREVLSQLATS